MSQSGVLGTPVIDTTTNRIYAVAQIAGATPVFHLFGLDLANGNTLVDVQILPTGFNWQTQQQRGALAVANGYVYLPFGGRGVHPFGSAPAVSASSYWPGRDIARGLVAWTGSGSPGGWVLDGWGGLHPFGGAPAVANRAYWAGWDIATSLGGPNFGSGSRRRA